MYKLEYLPVALHDMEDIARYISNELQNPAAAERLSEKIVAEADKIPAFPYSNPAYIPVKPLRHEYRKLLIDNFLLLYWVDEAQKIITVARVVYAKRDYRKLL